MTYFHGIAFSFFSYQRNQEYSWECPAQPGEPYQCLGTTCKNPQMCSHHSCEELGTGPQMLGRSNCYSILESSSGKDIMFLRASLLPANLPYMPSILKGQQQGTGGCCCTLCGCVCTTMTQTLQKTHKTGKRLVKGSDTSLR